MKINFLLHSNKWFINGWSNRIDESDGRLLSILLFITSWIDRFVGEGSIDEAREMKGNIKNSIHY